ncbi:MAG TPA: hypothetical protein DCP11_12070 [Microbacteriaceae bacterium]|nr:hypothetical protein [Microbacteriaceae bacterium]
MPSYDGPSFRNRSISAVPESPAPSSEAERSSDGAAQPEQSSYRVRDFSPDGRRATFGGASAVNWAPPVAPGAPPVELEYHTQAAVPPSSLASAPPPSVDYTNSAFRAEAAPERTMTRREMRALEQSGVLRPIEDAPVRSADEVPRLRERIRNTAVDEEQSAGLSDAVADFDSLASTGAGTAPPAFAEPPVALVEPPAHPTVYVASLSTTESQPAEHDQALVDDHVVEATIEPEGSEASATWFDAIADEQAADDTAVVEQEPFSAGAANLAEQASPRAFTDSPASSKFEELLFNAPVADVPESFVAQLDPEPVEVDAHAEPAQPIELKPAPAEWLAAFPPMTAHEIVVPAHAPSAPVAPEAAVVEAPPVAEIPVPEAPATELDAAGSYSPPVGHWSTQASIDDDEQVQENTFSRNVGATSGAITTSALVLPSIPTADDILSPLGSTGEILITGSINLPSSMGTTGVHPARYDHSDVDALLEAGDREDSDQPDSAPVRAIRAVSTHTSSGAVISAKKPKGDSRLPIVLAVSAAAMAVGVVVLFVVGMIFKIF